MPPLGRTSPAATRPGTPWVWDRGKLWPFRCRRTMGTAPCSTLLDLPRGSRPRSSVRTRARRTCWRLSQYAWFDSSPSFRGFPGTLARQESPERRAAEGTETINCLVLLYLVYKLFARDSLRSAHGRGDA